MARAAFYVRPVGHGRHLVRVASAHAGSVASPKSAPVSETACQPTAPSTSDLTDPLAVATFAPPLL